MHPSNIGSPSLRDERSSGGPPTGLNIGQHPQARIWMGCVRFGLFITHPGPSLPAAGDGFGWTYDGYRSTTVNSVIMPCW
jgi:hypothetical protein